MLLGLPGDATYANYREANRALWRLTVLPLCAKILEAISQGLAGWFDGAALRVDLDRVPALAEDRMALWREVSGADWLTADEKKTRLGRSEEHTSELQSLMRNSYAVFCLKKKKT